MLKKYSNPDAKFSPALNNEMMLDEDFIPQVDQMILIGKKYGITFIFISGFRLNSDHIAGAVVTPATMSNHFVGCAIDFNLKLNDILYNSQLLSQSILPEEIKNMIDEIKATGIRWGGIFRKIDVIHFDNGLNISDPDTYNKKYAEYHSGI